MKTITLILISGTIVSALIYYINFDLYRTLIKEDGLYEYITAFTLLLSSMLLLFRLVKTGRSKTTAWIIFNVLLISGLFFGFGEEISWGQRIFSLESGDFFLENNLQKETNLHNLKLHGVKINIVLFSYIIPIVFGLYFFFSLLLYKKNQFVKNLIDKFGIPIPGIHHIIILLIAALIITTVPENRKWELWECSLVLILFLVLLQPYNTSEKLIPGKNKRE